MIMTQEERNEYEDLQDYFLAKDGKVNSKKKRDRLNELGRLSVEDRQRQNMTRDLGMKWDIDFA
jgi:hypothetical protein